MAGEIAVGPVKPVPSGNILTNLLSHSNFDNAGWTSGANCTIAFDSTIKKYGDYSLKVTSTASSKTECYFYSDQYPPQIQGHIYYGRCEMYQDTAGVSSGMQIYWPEAEPNMGSSSYDSSNINTWQIQSFRVVRNSWSSGNQRFRFDVEQIQSPNYVYIDGAVLIDLTATYGSGNEPTQEWCDANIPYFSGTIIDGKLKAGDVIDFDYTGAAQSISLPAGKYKLECWGAQGGYRGSSTYGGNGGYSVGTLNLEAPSIIYVYTGGSGNTGGTSGGFNGGGVRYRYNGGGGASDIRIGTDSFYARVIVAGGGGSDGSTSRGGGVGGGTSGAMPSTTSYGTNYSKQGTATGVAGGSSYLAASKWTSANPTTAASTYAGFGFGGAGPYSSNGYGGAGGGGWYGGGGNYPDGSGDDDAGGAGGSGYVYTSETAASYPDGCLLDSSYYLTDAQTIAGNGSITSPSGGSETGHTGNGFARITVIEVSPTFSAPVKISGNWKVASDGFVKINGAWKSVEQGFVKINGTWKEIS